MRDVEAVSEGTGSLAPLVRLADRIAPALLATLPAAVVAARD
jgi:hypothetical protein